MAQTIRPSAERVRTLKLLLLEEGVFTTLEDMHDALEQIIDEMKLTDPSGAAKWDEALGSLRYALRTLDFSTATRYPLYRKT